MPKLHRKLPLHRCHANMTSHEETSGLNVHEMTYLCHGCNIMLKDTTRRIKKFEYLGSGQCVGCEFYTEDGYIVRLQDSNISKDG